MKNLLALGAITFSLTLTACSNAATPDPTVTPDYTPTPIAVSVITLTPTPASTATPEATATQAATETPAATSCPCPVTWTTTPVMDDKGNVLHYTAPDAVQQQVKEQLLEAYIAFYYPNGFTAEIGRQNAELYTVNGSDAYRGKLKGVEEDLKEGEYLMSTAPRNPSFDPIQFNEDGTKATAVLAFPKGDMQLQWVSISTGTVLETRNSDAKAHKWYLIYNVLIGRWQIEYNEKLEVKE